MNQIATIKQVGSKYKLYLNDDFSMSWEWAEATEAGIRYLANYAKQKLRATKVEVINSIPIPSHQNMKIIKSCCNRVPDSSPRKMNLLQHHKVVQE